MGIGQKTCNIGLLDRGGAVARRTAAFSRYGQCAITLDYPIQLSTTPTVNLRYGGPPPFNPPLATNMRLRVAQEWRANRQGDGPAWRTRCT